MGSHGSSSDDGHMRHAGSVPSIIRAEMPYLRVLRAFAPYYASQYRKALGPDCTPEQQIASILIPQTDYQPSSFL